jgi:hypothetical protein
MGFTIWVIVEFIKLCKANQDPYGGCGFLGVAPAVAVGILVATLMWIFISFAICAAGAVVAWREASKMSADSFPLPLYSCALPPPPPPRAAPTTAFSEGLALHAHPEPEIRRSGCLCGVSCLHVAIIVFGCIHVVVGIINLLDDNIVGLVFAAFALTTGVLGIVAGAMVNPCGCWSDPAGGTFKCAAILSVINSVIHAAEMGFTIWVIVEFIKLCKANQDPYGGCGFLGVAPAVAVGILVAILMWIFISFAICAAGAVVAWREASKMSADQVHRQVRSVRGDMMSPRRHHGREAGLRISTERAASNTRTGGGRGAGHSSRGPGAGASASDPSAVLKDDLVYTAELRATQIQKEYDSALLALHEVCCVQQSPLKKFVQDEMN